MTYAGAGTREQHAVDAASALLRNLQTRPALTHTHEGQLGFEHLSFYVVPAEEANANYRKWLNVWHNKPKRDGGVRKLGNMAVHVPAPEMAEFQDAWALIKAEATGPRRGKVTRPV